MRINQWQSFLLMPLDCIEILDHDKKEGIVEGERRRHSENEIVFED